IVGAAFVAFAVFEPDPRRSAKKKLAMTSRASRIYGLSLALAADRGAAAPCIGGGKRRRGRFAPALELGRRGSGDTLSPCRRGCRPDPDRAGHPAPVLGASESAIGRAPSNDRGRDGVVRQDVGQAYPGPCARFDRK